MYSLRPGDVLFIRVNGSLDIVGRCVRFNAAPEEVCFNDHLIRVRLDSAVFDPAYVEVMANSPFARAYMRRTAITTAGQNTINQTMLGDMPIPVPALAEQRRIVEYLDNLQATVDALKKLQEETAKELNALMPSILSKAFSGDL